MPNIVAKIIAPGQLASVGNQSPFPMERYTYKCLAQGDSWFSIGAIPPWSTTNLLDQMVFSDSMVLVNCARPGEELAHMTDTVWQKPFLRLLRGNLSYKWDGIFLSGGGNDLIDALQAPPTNKPGQRILRSDWGSPDSGVARYISEDGWTSFVQHMGTVFDLFLAERDNGQNAGIPVFFHTYDYPTPRNAQAFAGAGPWLYKALHDIYEIPQEDWVALTDELFLRMAAMMHTIAANRAGMHLHVVDTAGTIVRADVNTTGISNDWENEIHPTAHGYSQLAQKWRPTVEVVLKLVHH